MRDIAAKTDNVGDTLAAAAFNANLKTELQAVVTQTGQTLDPEAGPDTDQNMIGKALAVYSSDNGFYQDSGAADAYILGRVGNLQPVPAYFDGMGLVFKAGNANTGASTINVTTLGVKDIKRQDGNPLVAGDIAADEYIECRYDSGNGWFALTTPEKPSNSFVSTSVFSGAPPALYGNLDLSSYVGAQNRMVYLRVINNEGIAMTYRFRTPGHTTSVGDTGCTGGNVSDATLLYVWVKTDSNGVVEWGSLATAGTTEVVLEMFI